MSSRPLIVTGLLLLVAAPPAGSRHQARLDVDSSEPERAYHVLNRLAY
jgi:hypothetical protein